MLDVWVSDAIADVTVTTTATCAIGGSSEPLSVAVEYLPFAGLTVTLAATTYDATATDAVDPSAGVTAPAEALTFDVLSDAT